MGKSLPCTINLQAQKFNNNNNNNNRRKKYYKPKSESLFFSPETSNSVSFSTKKKELNLKMENLERHSKQPLSEVVSDCVRRWFQDTLKEAKAGDIGMQVLVGQMYYSGYGVPRDAQKGRSWITKASKSRSSVWKVCDKHPGYNASDSDSDELKDEENGDSTATNN